jgi:UDP-N-acetylmuramyl-tripeptide synthetase
MLGVMGALRAMNVDFEEACNALSECTSVPGRMECIQLLNQPLMVVDYAHTPDALTKVLKALRPLALNRGGRLWCVFGCGGNRDASKRALMAQAAQRNADRILVTSDNPRFEDPQDIVEQMMHGFDSIERVSILLELDRSLAIARAARDADDRDVILIAGKGHEDYQEIAGVRHAFSDQLHARSALAQRSRGETKWQTS